jgi:hypothetical protein
MDSERRQFSRFEVAEGALAFDNAGQQLGRITVAGGGGMAIELDPECSAEFTAGQQLQLTVVEPAMNARHAIHVVVRRKDERSIGVEFVRGQGA